MIRSKISMLIWNLRLGSGVSELKEDNEIDYKPVLQDLLQTAILIEHSTIPPYLTALYSDQGWD